MLTSGFPPQRLQQITFISLTWGPTQTELNRRVRAQISRGELNICLRPWGVCVWRKLRQARDALWLCRVSAQPAEHVPPAILPHCEFSHKETYGCTRCTLNLSWRIPNDSISENKVWKITARALGREIFGPSRYRWKLQCPSCNLSRAKPASLTSFEKLNCVWPCSDSRQQEVHSWHRRPHDQMETR